MNKPWRIVPYDLTRGEKVTYGYFIALEVILKQFLSELESYFFDQFNISAELDFKIHSNLKFKDYLSNIPQPTPIFNFGLSSLKGDALLIMDNAFANFLMAKKSLKQDGRVTITKHFSLDDKNHPRLQDEVEEMVKGLAKSFSRFEPTTETLKKLVAHRIKAKVLNPMESVVTATILFSYKGFRTSMEFCFSAYQLDPFLKKWGKKALLAGDLAADPGVPPLKLREYIEQDAAYRVRGVLGKLNLSQETLETAYKAGTILPLQSALKGNMALTVNNLPLLAAEPGMSRENHAAKVTGEYIEITQEVKKRPVPFQKISFPKG